MKLSSPVYSTLWLVVEKLLILALSFSVTIAVARHLMPEVFGRLSFLLALASLATPLMSLGLNSLISREVLRRPDDQDHIIGSAMVLRWSIGVLVGAVGALCAYTTLPPEEAILLTLILFASTTNAALIVDFWLQALVANRYAALSRLFVVLVFSTARLFAIALDASIPVFIYLVAAEFIVLNLGYLCLFHFLSKGLGSLRVSLAECRTLLKDSGWLLFSGIAAVLYLKIDQVMLGILVNNSAVGIYAVAVKFSEVSYFIPAAIVTSYFPQLIEKRIKSSIEYHLDIQKLNDLLFTLAVVLIFAVHLSAEYVIPSLFGELYADSVPLLQVHIWAALFVFMRTLLSKWLINESLFRLSFISQMAGACCNISLNFYFIPIYGAMGAAYATVVSHGVAGYLVLLLHSDLRPMATVIGRSILLPWRLIRRGRKIYEPTNS